MLFKCNVIIKINPKTMKLICFLKVAFHFLCVCAKLNLFRIMKYRYRVGGCRYCINGTHY